MSRFSAVRGCPRSCARTNPWFRGRILGEKRAQEPPAGSAVKHCRFLGTGGGCMCIPLRLMACACVRACVRACMGVPQHHLFFVPRCIPDALIAASHLPLVFQF